MTRTTTLGAMLLATVAIAGCSSGAAPSQAIATATPPVVNVEPTAKPTAEPASVDEPTAEPTAVPAPPKPKSYAKVSARDWAKIVKAPDNYLGKGYVVWACITQFDAATGTDTFRGDASFKNLGQYWYDGANTFFSGSTDQLADFVANDIVTMNVTSLGSFSYDTQAGGNTTVPLFQVDKITRKGSCS